MNPPTTLPTYIFLLSDTSTRQLACDVASALAERDNAVFVDDFLSPIHEAFSAMWELDMKRDLASPSNTNRLMIEYRDGGDTEGDAILDLEQWFCDRFGPDTLGRIARGRCESMRADFDYTFVFRDANVNYIKPFIDNLGWHKLLFVWLKESPSLPLPTPIGRTIDAYGKSVDAVVVDAVVKAIMEFDA